MHAVLFDLDGTLLDIRIEEFIARYFEALSHTMTTILPAGADIHHAMRSVHTATSAMMTPHPGRTNRDVFNEEFLELVCVDLAEHQPALDDFYERVFPGLRQGIGPVVGAAQALACCRSCDLSVAVATNPIFPARAIEHRMSWAGISAEDVDYVTSYETMYACKPHPDYFRQVAGALGLDPADCLMVGDDRYLDMPASEVGMRTFYVGREPDAEADYHGTLSDLTDLLRRTCDR
jgi:FMN phosphatase YigB (HAD superfamily)